jgi:hypothetical protein
MLATRPQRAQPTHRHQERHKPQPSTAQQGYNSGAPPSSSRGGHPDHSLTQPCANERATPHRHHKLTAIKSGTNPSPNKAAAGGASQAALTAPHSAPSPQHQPPRRQLHRHHQQQCRSLANRLQPPQSPSSRSSQPRRSLLRPGQHQAPPLQDPHSPCPASAAPASRRSTWPGQQHRRLRTRTTASRTPRHAVTTGRAPAWTSPASARRTSRKPWPRHSLPQLSSHGANLRIATCTRRHCASSGGTSRPAQLQSLPQQPPSDTIIPLAAHCERFTQHLDTIPFHSTSSCS